MPLFMDLHMVPGAVLDDVVEAHKLDVAVQEQFGCSCMTFWFDQSRGHAFCLIEAPNKEAVLGMHIHTHGLVPYKIIEVNSNLVAAFLGRIQDPESLDELSKSDIKAFYSDPAFRILLVTNSLDLKLLVHSIGQVKAYEVIASQNQIIRTAIQRYEGSEIEMEGQGLISSFIVASQAVQCAIEIQKQMHQLAEILHFKISLHAGIPVANSKELFGETMRYARHLCLFGQSGQVILSSLLNSLYKEGNHTLNAYQKIKIVSPEEEFFLESLIESLSGNWTNPEFDVSDLCRQLSVSNSQLYRRTISAIGLAPNVLLREYRLSMSLSLLKKGSKNIAQAAFDSGFNSPSYFTKCFQKKFKLKPLDYLKQKT